MVVKQRHLTLLYQGDGGKGDLNLCDKKGNGFASRLVVTSFLSPANRVLESQTLMLSNNV
jgi:hypothetical protein